MKRWQTTLAVVTLSLFSSISSAEVLILDAISEEPENTTTGLLRPKNGMTKDQVRKAFGAPEQEIPAVGNPPIGRWVYEKYSVFFEYDLVLNTVVHR